MLVIVSCNGVLPDFSRYRVPCIGLRQPFFILDTDDALVESAGVNTLQRLKDRGFEVYGVQDVSTQMAIVAENSYRDFLNKAGRGGVLPYKSKFSYNKDKSAVKITIRGNSTTIRIANKVNGADSAVIVYADKTPAFKFSYKCDDEIFDDIPLNEDTVLKVDVCSFYRLDRMDYQVRVALGFELCDTETLEHLIDLFHTELIFDIEEGKLLGGVLGVTYPYYPKMCSNDCFTDGDNVGNFQVLIPTP